MSVRTSIVRWLFYWTIQIFWKEAGRLSIKWYAKYGPIWIPDPVPFKPGPFYCYKSRSSPDQKASPIQICTRIPKLLPWLKIIFNNFGSDGLWISYKVGNVIKQIICWLCKIRSEWVKRLNYRPVSKGLNSNCIVQLLKWKDLWFLQILNWLRSELNHHKNLGHVITIDCEVDKSP